MAKKTPTKKTVRPMLRVVEPKAAKLEPEPELPEPPEPDEDDELEVDAGDSELDEALAELGASADAMITVNKVGQRGEERIGKFTPMQFDIDELRDSYGAGTYVIYGRAGTKLMHKKRVTFAQTQAELRGDRASTLRAQATAAGLSVHGPANVPQLDSLTIMREMYERQAMQQRETMNLVIEAIRGRPAAPAIDPLELQRAVLDSAQRMIDLRGESSGGGGIDTLMRGIELGRRFNGSGSEAGFGEVAVEFFRSITPLLTDKTPPAAAPSSSSSPSSSAPPAASVPPMVRMLQQYTPLLARAAMSEADPGVYAQLMLDQLAEGPATALLRVLERPDWWTIIRPYVPQLEVHLGWLSRVRQEFVDALQPKPEPEQPPTEASDAG